jgi:hypothetical protein
VCFDAWQLTSVGGPVAVYALEAAWLSPQGYQPAAYAGSGPGAALANRRLAEALRVVFAFGGVPVVSIESLVLLSGPIAVGKTSVRQELLAAHGYDQVRSSAYLVDLAGKLGESLARTSLQDLGDRLDRDTDYRWVLDEVALPAFAATPSKRRWLVDAVRKRRQVGHFRQAFGSLVLHVHLNAPEDVLRERYCARLPSARDATPYDVAARHENEVASRDLIFIADLVLDASIANPQELAQKIAMSADQRR